MAKINNDMTETRIWIELDPTSVEEVGNHRCKLANKMLEKLGCTIHPIKGCMFEWRSGGYVFYIGGGPFEELSDNGKWLNLEFLAE